MVSIEFRHVNLFIIQQNSIRVLVPRTGHKGTVSKAGSTLSGLPAKINANLVSGAPSATATVTGGRLPSINSILAGALAVDTAVAALTHYDITLPLGTLTANAPNLTSPFDRFANSDWTFPGTTVVSRLTNSVTYTANGAQMQFLDAAGNVLHTGTSFIFDNDDDSPGTLTKNSAGQVILPQFELLYELLGHQNGPIPQTNWISPPAPLVFGMPPSPDLPMCSAACCEI